MVNIPVGSPTGKLRTHKKGWGDYLRLEKVNTQDFLQVF